MSHTNTRRDYSDSRSVAAISTSARQSARNSIAADPGDDQNGETALRRTRRIEAGANPASLFTEPDPELETFAMTRLASTVYNCAFFRGAGAALR